MRSKPRVIIYGDDVALAGIKASLCLERSCEVISLASGATQLELCRLHPEVVVFELGAFPPEWLYELSKELPGLLQIGIDPETNRALLWSGQQAEGWTSQDLAQVILHAKFLIPSTGRNK